MKLTIYNESMLDTACMDMYRLLNEKKAINLYYEEYKSPKTKKQLGFFFSAICEAVVDYYHDKGLIEWNENAVKELFYSAVSPKKPFQELIKSIWNTVENNVVLFADDSVVRLIIFGKPKTQALAGKQMIGKQYHYAQNTIECITQREINGFLVKYFGF